jgi:protein-disulfide isomerase
VTILDRRALMGAAASFIAAAPALAQRRPPGAKDTVDVATLMAPGPAGDLITGAADAPCTIVEYASKTCPACANFHAKVYPALKEKYIDTGKVRFVYREFLRNDLDTAASMLGRCAGAGDANRSLAMISALFARQEQWAFVRTNPVPELFKVARQAGFTQQAFEACLTDQKLMENLTAASEKGFKEFGVNATPTFFINGKLFDGRSDQLDGFVKVIEPLIAPKT